MKVTKAVIPAAGLGTRVLPATKSMPKEMLPIVDKPAIQYIVEEAVRAGITDILIITNRGKGLIEDHFDRVPELEARLSGNEEKRSVYHEVVDIAHLANFYFVRQKETRGLGHAVSCARSFVGNEPFAVLYGDDVIIGEDPACGQLIRAYEEFGKGVLGVNQVSPEAIQKYSSLKVEPIRDNLFHCTDMVEKPAPENVLSLYSILGRCVLTPDIFDILVLAYSFWCPLILVPLAAAFLGIRSDGRAFRTALLAGLLSTLVWNYLLHRPFGIDGAVVGTACNLLAFSLRTRQFRRRTLTARRDVSPLPRRLPSVQYISFRQKGPGEHSK